MGQSLMKRHAELVDQMAGTLGVDLEEAAMRGNLPMDCIADLVLRCSGCSNADDCTEWLAERASTGATHAPHYCRNATELEGLRVEG